ncbi:phosphohistidine phosphatase [Azospirillaceae bacterium]
MRRDVLHKKIAMKTLFLMRHGKAVQDDSVENDHERSLTPRGVRAARRVGRAIAKDGLRPDFFLCSSARRTVETLDVVADVFSFAKAPILQEPQLYLCGCNVLFDRVQALPEQYNSVMVVGHNPDVHLLSQLLIHSGDAGLMESLLRKFPTAGCAVLMFSVEQWREIAPYTGRFVQFYQPKALDAES